MNRANVLRTFYYYSSVIIIALSSHKVYRLRIFVSNIEYLSQSSIFIHSNGDRQRKVRKKFRKRFSNSAASFSRNFTHFIHTRKLDIKLTKETRANVCIFNTSFYISLDRISSKAASANCPKEDSIPRRSVWWFTLRRDTSAYDPGLDSASDGT